MILQQVQDERKGGRPVAILQQVQDERKGGRQGQDERKRAAWFQFRMSG